MADVEYTAKDGSTEIRPLFPQSEIQIVRFMLGNATVELHNNQLANGSKTVDIFIRQNQELKNVPLVMEVESPAQPGNEIDPELAAKKEEAINEVSEMNDKIRQQTGNDIDPEVAAMKEEAIKKFNEMKEKRRKHKEQSSSVLLVLVSVYIALTYQAGLSPPGGLWQDDLYNPSSSNTANFASQRSMSNDTNIPSNNTSIPSNDTSTPPSETHTYPDHTAGDSILQDKDRMKFFWFYYTNSVAFSSSLITIVILLSETYASSDWLAVGTVKCLILAATVFIGIAFTLGSAYQYGPHANVAAIFFICWYLPFLIFDFFNQKRRYKKMQQACEV